MGVTTVSAWASVTPETPMPIATALDMLQTINRSL